MFGVTLLSRLNIITVTIRYTETGSGVYFEIKT